jgi:alkyl sulfatase BDS1-like metallo-beta-lactamase superfamily hydrolase
VGLRNRPTRGEGEKGRREEVKKASFSLLPRRRYNEVIAKQTSFPEAVATGKVELAGNPMQLAELIGLMDEFPRMFEIVEPKRTMVK